MNVYQSMTFQKPCGKKYFVQRKPGSEFKNGDVLAGMTDGKVILYTISNIRKVPGKRTYIEYDQTYEDGDTCHIGPYRGFPGFHIHTNGQWVVVGEE